jgi:rubredoxin
MPLWAFTPVRGSHLAIRIRGARDRARRVVIDENSSDVVREEWRCSSCGHWFDRETVSLVESGRAVAGVPEISAYCAPCNSAPRRPLAWKGSW